MHCLAVAIAFGTAFVFTVAGQFLQQDDTSLDLFSDVGWPDTEDSSLSFNDGGIIEDYGSDPLFASACGTEGDLMQPSKLRIRDGEFCGNKDSTSNSIEIPTLNNIAPEESQPAVPSEGGVADKCKPPFKINLCCDGRLFGLRTSFVWNRIDKCYASKSLKMHCSSVMICC